MSKNAAAETVEIPHIMRGLRMTKQRKEVYRLLAEKKHHPTAQELYQDVKENMPSISLATIYNCLEALVEHDVIKQVNFDREPSRYCSNQIEHGHFYDQQTGEIFDITLKQGLKLEDIFDLPKGTSIENLEITMRGKLPNSNTPAN